MNDLSEDIHVRAARNKWFWVRFFFKTPFSKTDCYDEVKMFISKAMEQKTKDRRNRLIGSKGYKRMHNEFFIYNFDLNQI